MRFCLVVMYAFMIALSSLCFSSLCFATQLNELNEKAYYLPPRQCVRYIASLRDPSEAAFVRGLVKLKNHRERGAGVEFDFMLNRKRDDIRGLWGKAELLRRQCEYQKALQMLESVFAVEQTFVPALVTRAYIQLVMGEPGPALRSAIIVEKLYRCGKPVDRPNLARALIIIAGAKALLVSRCSLVGKLQAFSIKRYILRAVEVNPLGPEVISALGDFYMLAPSFLGGAKPDVAIRLFKKALHLDPGYTSTLVRLARAYYRTGDMVSMRACMGNVWRLDPQNRLVEELSYLR